MNKKNLLIIGMTVLIALSLTACKKEEEVVTSASLTQVENTDETIYTPGVETVSTQTATTTASTTTAKTTVKTTTATTKAPAKVNLSSDSGSKLVSVRSAYEKDGNVYITCVYLKEGAQQEDEDGEVYVDLPTEIDGTSKTFMLSKDASIAFSDDFGYDTTSITTGQFVAKFNGTNQGDGINYTATINGSKVSSLKFFYVP